MEEIDLIESVSTSGDEYILVMDGVTMTVPLDTSNRHYQLIQQWIANGGVLS